MHASVADWLPPGCIESPDAARPMASAIAQWGQHWFAAQPWAALGGWQRDGGPVDNGWTVLRSQSQMSLTGVDRAALRLAHAVLGLPEQPRYTETDLRILRRLAARVLDDLEQRMAELLHPHSSGAATSSATYTLLIGPTEDEPVLALQCAAAQLIPIVRRTFPPLLSRTDLTDRLSACSDHELDIAAVLGSATLTIEQIAQFEIGDVIVLDQPSDQPVPLAIADNLSDLRCQLGERDGQIILEVLEQA